MKFFRGSRLSGCARGFSLVELLVVIGVIAIMVAIAIPNLASISSKATFAKSQGNAQAIASVAAAARAAGYTNDWETVANAVSLLTDNNGAGLTVGAANFRLGVSSLSDDEITNVVRFLDVSDASSPDILLYLGPIE